MTDAASLVFCLGFAALLADAAVSDLRGFRIANRDPILMVILFTVSSPFRLELTEIPLHLLAGAAAFAVGALALGEPLTPLRIAGVGLVASGLLVLTLAPSH